MRLAFNLALAFGLLISCSAVQAQNLLTNGELDAPGAGLVIDDWDITFFKTFTGDSTDGITLEPWADRNNDGFGAFFKAFQGNSNINDLANVIITQDVAATPGAPYTFSGWARGEDNYSAFIPASPTQTLFAIDFDDDGDAGNGVLSTVELELVTAGLNNDWAEYSVSGVAPAGASVARARVSMLDAYNNPAGGGQAFIVDELSLVGVPEPASLGLLALGLAGAVARRRR